MIVRFINLNLIQKPYCLNKNMEESCMSKLATSNKELIGYIKRCVPDIARKCGVKNHEVIQTFKTLFNDED